MRLRNQSDFWEIGWPEAKPKWWPRITAVCRLGPTISRMISEFSLPFCITASRGKAQAEHPIGPGQVICSCCCSRDCNFASGRENSVSMLGAWNQGRAAHCRWTNIPHKPGAQTVLDAGGRNRTSFLGHWKYIHLHLKLFGHLSKSLVSPEL